MTLESSTVTPSSTSPSTSSSSVSLNDELDRLQSSLDPWARLNEDDEEGEKVKKETIIITTSDQKAGPFYRCKLDVSSYKTVQLFCPVAIKLCNWMKKGPPTTTPEPTTTTSKLSLFKIRTYVSAKTTTTTTFKPKSLADLVRFSNFISFLSSVRGTLKRGFGKRVKPKGYKIFSFGFKLWFSGIGSKNHCLCPKLNFPI